MRKNHILVKETGSTVCGITQLSVQEKYHMSKPYWNKYITCSKCKKELDNGSCMA